MSLLNLGGKKFDSRYFELDMHSGKIGYWKSQEIAKARGVPIAEIDLKKEIGVVLADKGSEPMLAKSNKAFSIILRNGQELYLCADRLEKQRWMEAIKHFV